MLNVELRVVSWVVSSVWITEAPPKPLQWFRPFHFFWRFPPLELLTELSDESGPESSLNRQLWLLLLVTGLEIDKNFTPSQTCKACIQAKQTVQSFPKTAEGRSTTPGKRTLSDVWGLAQTTLGSTSQVYKTEYLCNGKVVLQTTLIQEGRNSFSPRCSWDISEMFF